jgi:hypothetical protein
VERRLPGGEVFGIRGGMTPRPRLVMLRQIRSTPVVAERVAVPVSTPSSGRRSWPHRPYVTAL